MRDHPDGPDLLALLSRIEDGDPSISLPDDERYLKLMLAHAKAIAGRQEERGCASEARELQDLGSLLGSDGGDGEIAVGNRRLDPIGNVDMAEMDAVADIETGKIDHDGLRYGVDRAKHLNRVAHNVQHAAARQPNAIFFIDELASHFDGNLGRGTDPKEIDMLGHVGHRMQLDLARQHPFDAAIDLDFIDGRKESPGLQILAQFKRGDGN